MTTRQRAVQAAMAASRPPKACDLVSWCTLTVCGVCTVAKSCQARRGGGRALAGVEPRSGAEIMLIENCIAL